MKKKIVKSKKRVPKFQDGGIGKLKPRTALEAAKDLKINPTIATAQTLEEQSASAKDLLKGLMRPPVKEVTSAAPAVSTPKSIAAKNSKTISDSYKKSLQGLMDKGKSIDDLVKLGYGTKQGLTNLGLTAPKKATTPKPTAPKKGGSPKPTTPKKPTASDLKKEGQRLKAEGMKQKGIGMAIKGKGLRNKAIAETLYIKIGTSENPIATKIREIKYGKKQTKEAKDFPNKSVLTETEKKAIAKYKASPKYKKSLKVDSKKFSSDELAKSNYGNNIVGDLIGGPVKAAAVGVGAGLYGLYKGIKAVKGAKAAVTNFGKKLATETAEKLAKSKGTTSKAFLKSNADKLKVMSKRKATQKGGLEKLLKQSTKTPKKEINKLFGKVNADKLKFRSQVNRTQKGGLGKMLERKGKVTKMKRGGKKY